MAKHEIADGGWYISDVAACAEHMRRDGTAEIRLLEQLPEMDLRALEAEYGRQESQINAKVVHHILQLITVRGRLGVIQAILTKRAAVTETPPA